MKVSHSLALSLLPAISALNVGTDYAHPIEGKQNTPKAIMTPKITNNIESQISTRTCPSHSQSHSPTWNGNDV